MALLKTKPIGNRQFESECFVCGETMLWQQGDDVFLEVKENGDKGLLCSKCYKGPRMTAEQLAEQRKKNQS